MAKYPIFDGHNDTLLRLYKNEDLSYKDFFTEMEDGHIDLPRSKKGGFAGGFFAIFVPNQQMAVKTGKQAQPQITRST